MKKVCVHFFISKLNNKKHQMNTLVETKKKVVYIYYQFM